MMNRSQTSFSFYALMKQHFDIAILGKDFEFELSPELIAFEMSMDFSDQIIKRCSDLDVSLSELAKMLGKSVSNVSEKLNGQNMTLKSMAQMALVLGCDIEAPQLVPLKESNSGFTIGNIVVKENNASCTKWLNDDKITQSLKECSVNENATSVSFETKTKVA